MKERFTEATYEVEADNYADMEDAAVALAEADGFGFPRVVQWREISWGKRSVKVEEYGF